MWQKKRLLLSQTSSVRIIDNQEQEEKQIRRPFPRLKVIQIPFHRGDKNAKRLAFPNVRHQILDSVLNLAIKFTF